jgi:hypothetical protein
MLARIPAAILSLMTTARVIPADLRTLKKTVKQVDECWYYSLKLNEYALI